MSRDSNRTRIWFPMFSYFESSVDGIIPNEYDSLSSLLANSFNFIICVKDSFMLTTRRFWIEPPYLSIPTVNIAQKNVATSTSSGTIVTAQISEEKTPLLPHDSNIKITSPD